MQSFKQTRDIIALSRRFHEQLGTFYEQLGEVVERGRVRLLLEYLSRHEQHLGVCLQRYEAELPERLLNAWLQYVPDAIPIQAIKAARFDPDMSIRQVTELALHLDDLLIAFYRALVDSAESAETRELFSSLLDLATNQEILLKREALTMQ